MLVATFNCNSVRKRIDHILDWLHRHKPDVLGLQETKVVDTEFPLAPFVDAGWHVSFRGEKSYNGVALTSRAAPDAVSFGLGGDDGASETRFVHATFGDLHVANAYVPQGSSLDSPKFAFKLEWFARAQEYFASRFSPDTDKVLWIGDLNVAPTRDDLYDPDKLAPHVCFCPEVIAAFEQVKGWGFVDVFRKHLPEPETYTFWDYRMRGAVGRNLGWRIDHILATPALAASSREVFVDLEPRLAPSPSDHTFVAARFAT